MFRALLANLVNRSRGRNVARGNCRPRQGARHALPPTLEALEDRCLMSVNTAVPSVVGASPTTVQGDQIAAFLPKMDANIVFLGDSITWGYAYGAGAPVWSAVLAPLGAVNYGVIGQSTQSLLYQLSLGQLTGTSPSVVVLTIGTNNLLEGNSPQDTATGILADVNAIHLLEPQAQVLVLGTPPGGPVSIDPSYGSAVSQTNALVSQQLVGDPRATFFNIAPALELPDGTISNAILFDYIHPTTLGYAEMTAALLLPLVEADLTSLHRRFAL